jgi:hypothetical protein
MSDAARTIPMTPDPTFWNPSAGDWDADFRAWAAPLLKLSAEHAGIAVIIIGQLIECAWRLRRINSTLAADANLTHRDWCRALAEAQRAFSRAHTDYQRWTRTIERGRERMGGRGAAPDATAARRVSRGFADSAPSTRTQAATRHEDTADQPEPNGSTYVHNLVANGAPERALQ